MSLGMVLEGGGMRGIYTAGVLDYFMENDFYPDGVMGVSAGAVHGASYVSKQIRRSYRINTGYSHNPEYMSLRSLILTGNYFGTEFAYRKIPEKLEPYDYETFDRFKDRMPFYVVATNVDTGRAEYLRIRDMKKEVDLIRASASLPLMARIVGVKGLKLLDGGVADSIPFEAMAERGYGKNIVILTRPEGYRKGKNEMLPAIRLIYGRKYPEFVDAVADRHIRYNETLERLEKAERDGEAFVLRPSEYIKVSRIEKNTEVLDRMYELGRRDAERSFKDILAFAGGSGEK